jgi:hypothetical protein
MLQTTLIALMMVHSVMAQSSVMQLMIVIRPEIPARGEKPVMKGLILAMRLPVPI